MYEYLLAPYRGAPAHAAAAAS
eukprot:SAG25_NODE_10890_length_320_cov_0.932127_1_plen_21_part_01